MSIIIDIEASGLHVESYPIEIAWFDYKTGESDSFLIKPASYWVYWDPNAEAVHGIPQEKLLVDGISVFEASDRIIERLNGRKVYSDAVPFDSMWLETLFEAAGEDQRIPFGSIYELVLEENYSKLSDKLSQSERPHRALSDCRIITNCILECQ